ncbi:MAG: deoxyribose-phosphate aldolase [Clostridia bacterium]|nr:deoxyribose-phosphate aldolase [Clostridia bacterium]
MELSAILAHCDHTLLRQDATWKEIQAVCDDGLRCRTASVCIPPSFVRQAKDYVGDQLAICTVIGFPNGYSTAESKVFETADAVANGADEIDMVINVGLVKEGRYDAVLDEIKAVRAACPGKVLKVIIETCLLTDEEKKALCGIVGESGADFIKTSTGFSTGGATIADIELFRANIPPHLKMKAAGGIRTLADAEAFLALGCERLGTSAIVKLAKQQTEGAQ